MRLVSAIAASLAEALGAGRNAVDLGAGPAVD